MRACKKNTHKKARTKKHAHRKRVRAKTHTRNAHFFVCAFWRARLLACACSFACTRFCGHAFCVHALLRSRFQWAHVSRACGFCAHAFLRARTSARTRKRARTAHARKHVCIYVFLFACAFTADAFSHERVCGCAHSESRASRVLFACVMPVHRNPNTKTRIQEMRVCFLCTLSCVCGRKL